MIIQERLKEMREHASCTSPHLGYNKAIDALEVAVAALEEAYQLDGWRTTKNALDQITKLLEGK